MRRPAIIAGILAGVVALAGVVVFSANPQGFSDTAVGLISVGLVMSTLVGLVGFLLVRAPWGRWALVGIVALAMVLSSAADPTTLMLVYIGGAVAVAFLVGPWLRFWTRKLPSADTPGAVPVSLMAVAPTAPIVIGLGAYDVDNWWLWVATGIIVTSATLYAWAVPGAVWLMRLLMPVGGIMAVAFSPIPWSVITLAGTLAVAVTAWTPAAVRTTTVPSPVLPSPRQPDRKDQPDASG